MLTHFISTAYPHQKHLVSRFTDHSLQFADSCSRLVRVDFHTAEFVALPFLSAPQSKCRAPALASPPLRALIPIRAPGLLVLFRTTWSLNSYNPLVDTIYLVEVGTLSHPGPQYFTVL